MNAFRLLRGLGGGSPIDEEMTSQVIDQIGVSARHHLQLQLRPVQQEAGRRLMTRTIVEMETGEGKTLTTVIAAALLALQGKMVRVATANDYLAARDADWMNPLYRDLGLSVSSITSQSSPEDRRQAYAANVTYGTLREFGFDYLRDRLNQRRTGETSSSLPLTIHRFDALIVDEADSVLIDEARTPLVISAATGELDRAMQTCYRWSAEAAAKFCVGEDFVHLTDIGAVALTERGRRRFLRMAMPAQMGSLTTTDILHSLERAILVNDRFHRDSHYVINHDRIALVDEFTGRAAATRALSGGLHQAIEAREGLPLTSPSQPIAKITVQDYVARFAHLSGITATAWEDRRELDSVYSLAVHRVPPHLPSQRRRQQTVVCRGISDKWHQIADEVQRLIEQRRAVLIGTRTVTQSEQLSGVLCGRSIEHVVLNARNPKRESETIARAGQPGQVTVATNMAGRGTDIRLDEKVAAAGGLHVIVSEPHSAARIDRQLIGRSGRQGDPGSARMYVSLDDEIIDQAHTAQRASQIRASAAAIVDDRKRERQIIAVLSRAQRIVCRKHRQQRKQMTAHQAKLNESMQHIGLDPYLDPLPENL